MSRDARGDLSGELWQLADLLEAEGNGWEAVNCRAQAVATRDGELSINRAIKLLCHYENLIGV